MGACLSSGGESSIHDDIQRSNSALVISANGDLRPYPTPVFVSDVLQMEHGASGSSSPFFVCNSDSLYYDEMIRALESDTELDAGQIYFVLPRTKLQQRLSASDMAALAVKASLALNSNLNSSGSSSKSKKTTAGNDDGVNGSVVKRKNNNRARISPFVVMETSQINVIVDEELAQVKRFSSSDNNNNYSFRQQNAGLGVSRSGSIRKLQRYSSKKARFAVRSFKLRLSTIYESENSDQAQEF